MATTDYMSAEALQYKYRTANKEIQTLLLRLAAAWKNQGKRSLFGKDKGAVAHMGVMKQIDATVAALRKEGLYHGRMAMGYYVDNINNAMDLYKIAYPNWEDAYAYWDIVYSIHRYDT